MKYTPLPPAPPSGAEEKPGREVVIQHCINVINGLDNSRQTKNLKKRTKLWCFRNNPTDPTVIFILHVRAVMPFLKVGKRLGIFPRVRESIYPVIRAPLIFSNICRIRNIVASFVHLLYHASSSVQEVYFSCCYGSHFSCYRFNTFVT